MDIKIESPDFILLEKTLSELSQFDADEIVFRSLRKGTKPTELQAQSNIVHSVTGNLKKSVGTIAMKTETAVIVGARKSKGFKGWHGHLVEDGTVERKYITKSGAVHRTGKMNSSGAYAGWLRKAVQSTEQQTMDIIANDIYKQIIEIHSRNGLK